jgi:hypothetical protein
VPEDKNVKDCGLVNMDAVSRKIIAHMNVKINFFLF